MKVIIQLQYSLTDSRVFHDVKNITQSSIHPTHQKLKKNSDSTQPNSTHGWTKPMTNSDHTRLTISRVIWRWILSWPWNMGKRSLKVTENGTIWKLGYGFLFAFYGNFCHFRDMQRQRMIWAANLGLGSFKVIENGAVLLVPNCNYSSILYCFRVIWRWVIS